jgi:hypothetical protein
MKKIYTLVLAIVVAITANAQVSVNMKSEKQNQQLPFKGIEKANSRSASGEGWVSIADYDATYWAQEQLNPGSAFYFQSDSMGLVSYSSGYGHPFMFSTGQTFDFNSPFFDEVSGEGDISFNRTPSLNIDSIYIQTMYFRDANTPAGTKDTVIVGIYTADSVIGYHFTSYANSCFWGLDHNTNTLVQDNAIAIYKFPIGDDEVSQPAEEEGYYYYTNLFFPIPVNNITNKGIHVAYTFKRGYEVAMEDTLPTTFTLYTYASYDPDYALPNDAEMRCINQSHGDYILAFSDGEIADFYYPGFALSSPAHYPRMAVKFSCSECEIVNVPEIEKTNMTVYPNPATNNFTVNLGNDEKANIQLFNLVGQMVYNETITGSAKVNVANLHSGVYMLKVNQNGKVYTTKVVVK